MANKRKSYAPIVQSGAPSATGSGDSLQFPTETIFLEYVDRAKRSALPPRLILLFVVLASAHAFLTLWNSLPGSWMNQRVRIFRDLLESIPQEVDKQATNLAELEKQISAIRLRYFLEITDEQELESAIRTSINMLEENRNQNIRMVRVPVLGVVFDVNDLGIFSGFVLIVLLTMYRYSLSREEDNILLAYDFAKKMDIRFSPKVDPVQYQRVCYEMISMAQIIISPPVRGRVPWYWQHWPKIGLTIPLVVQFAIVMHDIVSRPAGLVYSSWNTVVVLMVGFACLVIIFVLTVSSFRTWFGIEQFWGSAAKEIEYVGNGPDAE